MVTPIASGTPFSGFAVDDVEAARVFYADVLGLNVTTDHGMLSIHLTDDVVVLAYPKPTRDPASYTMLNLPVATSTRPSTSWSAAASRCSATTACRRTTRA